MPFRTSIMLCHGLWDLCGQNHVKSSYTKARNWKKTSGKAGRIQPNSPESFQNCNLLLICEHILVFYEFYYTRVHLPFVIWNCQYLWLPLSLYHTVLWLSPSTTCYYPDIIIYTNPIHSSSSFYHYYILSVHEYFTTMSWIAAKRSRVHLLRWVFPKISDKMILSWDPYG